MALEGLHYLCYFIIFTRILALNRWWSRRFGLALLTSLSLSSRATKWSEGRTSWNEITIDAKRWRNHASFYLPSVLSRRRHRFLDWIGKTRSPRRDYCNESQQLPMSIKFPLKGRRKERKRKQFVWFDIHSSGKSKFINRKLGIWIFGFLSTLSSAIEGSSLFAPLNI